MSDLLTREDLLREYVYSSEEATDEYMKEMWLLASIGNLVRSRLQAGLTQREVADALGTTQSAIARLEAGNDIKLSRLWDYLRVCGSVPSEVTAVPQTLARTHRADSAPDLSSANGMVDRPISDELVTQVHSLDRVNRR